MGDRPTFTAVGAPTDGSPQFSYAGRCLMVNAILTGLSFIALVLAAWLVLSTITAPCPCKGPHSSAHSSLDAPAANLQRIKQLAIPWSREHVVQLDVVPANGAEQEARR